MSQECPSCDRVFDTGRGLGVHHSSVHDEKLPNRTCAHCGDRFHSPHERKYCSDECLESSEAYAGENNGNYRGGKTETKCESCGTTFTYYPSEKRGLYCPACVKTENWRDPPTVAGFDHPNWNGGVADVACAVCGENVERRPYERASGVVVCSKECHRKWLSEAFAGNGHPNWKEDGGDLAYGSSWSEARWRALDRDGYECVVCGTDCEELGRNPDVHHFLPVRLFARSPSHDRSDAHYLGNLVTLCPACHRRAEHGTLPELRLREAANR